MFFWISAAGGILDERGGIFDLFLGFGGGFSSLWLIFLAFFSTTGAVSDWMQ